MCLQAKVQLEDAPLAGQRAQVILKPLLLRRTKNSMLEGKPILTLPPKDIEIVKLQFSDEEREVIILAPDVRLRLPLYSDLRLV
jgi:SNF2 family DNA or RNA helicase